VSLLPIVERELREAARKRRTFQLRTTVAVVTSLIAASMIVFSYGASTGRIGKGLFGILSFLAFFYCMVEGARNAADCVSEEKREGTLGLLFLTDLQGYDVVLGKFAAVAARSFQGLVAFIPVLAVALIIGGVTIGEFWRTVVALINTLFFSLCLGVLVSCLSHSAYKALITVLGVLAAVTAMPFLLQKLAIWSSGTVRLLFGSISPAYAGYLSTDAAYSASPSEFWTSLVLSHAGAWGFLAASSALIPFAWQDREVSQADAVRKRFAWLLPKPAERAKTRERMLEHNPIFWLAARNEGERRLIWTLLIVSCGVWMGVVLTYRTNGPIVSVFSSGILFFITVTLRIWMALQGSRHLAEARSNQALELFLATPLSTEEIIAGQKLAAKHLFLGPTAVVAAAETFALLLQSVAGGNVLVFLPGIASTSYSIIRFVMDVTALWWLGMWMGLTQKNPIQALVMTLVFGMIIPQLLFCIPNVFIDLLLINWARTRLQREFRKIASERSGVAEHGVRKRVAVRASPSAVPPVIAR
jgi:hypothetical protein